MVVSEPSGAAVVTVTSVPAGVLGSIVQSCVAGVSSTASVVLRARTANVCSPSARLVYVTGEVQAAKAAPSSEHSKVAPATSAEKPKVAVLLSGSCGAESMVVSGVARTVQVWVAGVASGLAAPSTARTAKVCSPAARPLRSSGEEHPAKGSPSSEHSKERSPGRVPLSVPVNSTIASVASAMVAGGPDVMVVSGAPMSAMVHSWSAGVASTSRCCLMAVTSKVCAVYARPVYSVGDVHTVNGAPSSEHWRVASGSSLENVN